ncbi:MAG: MerR family transcriptional regulator [Bacteroidetes bacterium]|nr:MerR family transcriptional regulator [Bacteroidota bacterium]
MLRHINPEANVPKYTISAAANLVGLSVHAIRKYEREGLIIPFKKDSNQRLYTDSDIERLKCIRQTITEMSTEGIKRILSLIPCWSILHCGNSDRENCDAYTGYSKPCWVLKNKGEYCKEKDCRECQVYYSFGNCHSIKDKLKELL